jgi:hypothetical protein
VKLSTAWIGAGCLAMLSLAWVGWPSLNWPDRRPIGALFLASNAHVSSVNPRGWFNAPALDVVGVGGAERFRRMLLEYAGRALGTLRAARAQGMIVWDIEGEEYPQKISYIGDPRLLPALAPEMAPVVDEFFRRFTDAGLRVGVVIRPQQLVLDRQTGPRQEAVWESGDTLAQKIDYARRRWGATLFYIDSNHGFLLPVELLSLRWLARHRPGVLLIPEHHQPLYFGFSAPYAEIRDGGGATPGWIRTFYPHGFQVLNIVDSADRNAGIDQAFRNGDVLLFPAWAGGREARAVENIVQRSQ